MTLRIDYLISDFEGGTAHHLLGVTRHLDRDRWHTRILSTDPRTEGRMRYAEIVRYRRPDRLHRFPLAQIRELAWIVRRLRSDSPDILHTYFYWPIVYGRILKAIGMVDTLVENREDEGFNWSEREYRVLRATRSLPDRVVAVSASVRDVVLRREDIDPENVVVVHNAIDEPDPVNPDRIRELRQRHGVGDDAVLIGFVGNFERPVKGLRHLLEAMPSVISATPESRLFVVGRGPEEFRRNARKLGVEEAVTFTGATEDVHTYYELFDISVLPSLSEGLSLTLLESMAHGLPVVATAVGGNPEVVEDGVTGRLVGPADPEALAEALIELVRNPELRHALGKEGRGRAEEAFLQPAATDRYEQLYEYLIGPDR